MALVERLCQIDPDEPGGEPYERHIATEDFIGGLWDVLGGYHTVTAVKTFYDMTPADEAEMDTLVSQINGVPKLEKTMGRVQRVRSILTKWDRKEDLNVPGYDTVNDIRTQLNNLDDGFN